MGEMKRLDLWEVLGSAEMCAGVPEALQTPNPTQWLQECPQDMDHRGWLLPQPLRAQIFVFCVVLGYRGGSPGVCPQPLQAVGKGHFWFEEKTTAPRWCCCHKAQSV